MAPARFAQQRASRPGGAREIRRSRWPRAATKRSAPRGASSGVGPRSTSRATTGSPAWGAPVTSPHSRLNRPAGAAAFAGPPAVINQGPPAVEGIRCVRPDARPAHLRAGGCLYGLVARSGRLLPLAAIPLVAIVASPRGRRPRRCCCGSGALRSAEPSRGLRCRLVLVVLPPADQGPGGRGRPLDLDALWFPELSPVRAALVDGVVPSPRTWPPPANPRGLRPPGQRDRPRRRPTHRADDPPCVATSTPSTPSTLRRCRLAPAAGSPSVPRCS